MLHETTRAPSAASCASGAGAAGPSVGPAPAPAYAAPMAASRSPRKPSEPTFEERLEALEAVVRDLEGEDLPLEASLTRYREGVEQLRACRALLDDAEARLAELVEDAATGELRERALEVGEAGLEPAPDGD